MRLTRCFSVLMLSAVLLGAAVPAALAQGHPAEIPLGGVTTAPAGGASGAPQQLDEFVSIEDLPQQEQIPAANLLIPAYAFVWVAVLVYVISLARRLGAVEQDVRRFEKDLAQGKRS
jgi:CcmD family protein